MAEFMVELYVSRGDAAAVERVRLTAERLAGKGTPVRYLRSIFVPADETCYFLYEADSADAVREAARGAALRFERVTKAVTQSRREESSRSPHGGD